MLGFDSPVSEVSFSEGAVVGTRRLLELAKGPVTAYRIASGNEGNRFRLHETRSIAEDRIRYLHLETLKPLDREERDSYSLNITASTGSGDASTVIRVKVLDINDNPPAFR